jgi:Uma2 family endonuclease
MAATDYGARVAPHLTPNLDDESVVLMWRPLTVDAYLSDPETLTRRELEYGIVREPPAPFLRHQSVITRLAVIVEPQVRAAGLGWLFVSPVDVVFDEKRALVLQPDLAFVSTARQSILRDQIWGAPDLVVEVLSPGTAHRDRTKKMRWYRRYGVREAWLVAPAAGTIEVMTFPAGRTGRTVRRRFGRGATLVSPVLPDVAVPIDDVFEWSVSTFPAR